MTGITETVTGEWMELSAGFSPEEPLYVITDMHGCLEAMDRLLSHRPADARLVFLGDAIDRGPDPLGVISVLMTDGRNMLLRGNHDAMAWFSQPDVLPSVLPSCKWMEQNWMYNGGGVTRIAFREALKAGAPCGGIAKAVPRLFEDYWLRGVGWWRSGNLVFVHGGLPGREGREWLSMEPSLAASHENSPYWFRPDMNELYRKPRMVDGEEVFVVFGHTPMSPSHALLPFGISLDRGYELKMAAEMRPAEGGRPARVRFVSTECDEIRRRRS
ncbi:MAG: metallophosphoesterase [Desulfovibrio sp.]|jgi:hypothetical protein|nr:metallophosphoesterase [Desulfovibrio sp.]